MDVAASDDSWCHARAIPSANNEASSHADNNHIDLRKGAVYDPLKVKIAIDLIRRVLEANGQSDPKIVMTEQISAFNVMLTFVITRE